ncbi:MAG: hypothetical protein NUV77_26555 [Thermoguttaceae bacterium]|nr:hypothetical protein [Thermoguttaceae bacterium]
MAGHLHAAAILVLVAATVALLAWKGRAIPPDQRQARYRAALVALVTACVLGLIGSLHLCGAGTPKAQWVLPGICWALLMLFIPQRRLRRWLSAVSMVALVALVFHYLDLVHGRDYSGNPDWEDRVRARGRQIDVFPYWHTWLTGIYGKAEIEAAQDEPHAPGRQPPERFEP